MLTTRHLRHSGWGGIKHSKWADRGLLGSALKHLLSLGVFSKNILDIIIQYITHNYHMQYERMRLDRVGWRRVLCFTVYIIITYI